MNTVLHNLSNEWQLQQAKAQFSEVVNCALGGMPQLVTRSGRPAVYIVSAEMYRAEYARNGLNRKDIFLSCPKVALDIPRDRSDGREVVV